MSLKDNSPWAGGHKDPFPLNTGDKTVAALLSTGYNAMAQQLSYEIDAAGGNHLCNHFNSAAGVGRGTKYAIDMNRRAAAHERIGEMKAGAIRLLGYDPEDRKNDGGGKLGLTL